VCVCVCHIGGEFVRKVVILYILHFIYSYLLTKNDFICLYVAFLIL